jgi:uncharacterized membrane protein YdjX (TVP38/TMEM64 family)
MQTQLAEAGWVEFMRELEEMQNFIRNLGNKWLIVIAIMLVYAIRSFLPIPYPFLIIMTGVMFRPTNALIINTIGFCVVTTISYWFGRASKGGFAMKQLNKYENVKHILLSSKKGKTKLSVLVAARIIPAIPINLVSNMYGGMKYPFVKFMIASVIGFAPKIIAYTLMGGSIAQPFTWEFMAPIIILLLLTSIVTFCVNEALEKRKEGHENDEH